MAIRLAVFDMDGVLVRNMNSWRAVHEAFGTTNEDGLRAFMRGEIDDHEFIRRDVERWRAARGAVHINHIEDVLAEFEAEAAAHHLFEMFRATGAVTAIVSGGLEPLAKRIGADLGADHVFCNGLEVDEKGFLTGRGRVGVPLKDKGRLVRELKGAAGAGAEQVVAFGDTSIDVPMFREAGVGVAVDPKDEETRRAASHVVPDLQSALPIVRDLVALRKHLPE